MRADLEQLGEKDRQFVREHAGLRRIVAKPTDSILASRLGCTRRTIVNRRKRLRAKGVLIHRFTNRGFQVPIDPDQGYLFAIH